MSRAREWSSADVRRSATVLERRLVELGLARGPRRLLRASGERPSRQRLVESLAALLEELGGAYSAFGSYLGSRGDFFTSIECLRFSALRHGAPAASWSSILERLGSELGVAPVEAFAALDPEPLACDWLLQTHRGVLAEGRAVQLRIVRPGAEVELARLADRLAPLGRVYWPEGFDFAALVEDFRRHLETRIDLIRQAEHLEVLAGATEGSDLVLVASVVPAMCSPRVLCTSELAGSPLTGQAIAGIETAERAELSRRLALVWLQLALVARAFPVTAEVLVLDDGRLGLAHGTFASLPATSQVRLWNYLRAVATHHPERATDYLLRELIAEPKASSATELRLRLRQAVPFRDGAWSRSGDSLAEHVMLHWRLAREAGYQSRSHLLDFGRGLVFSASLAHRLDPLRDTLGEALDSLQWMAGWNQFRALSSPQTMAPLMEQGADLLLGLPQKIDHLLDLSERPGGFRVPLEQSATSERRRNRWTVAGALAALMVAVVLVAPALRRAGLAEHWAEGGAAVLFLLLGALLLTLLASND